MKSLPIEFWLVFGAILGFFSWLLGKIKKNPKVKDVKKNEIKVPLEDFYLENETKVCANCNNTIKLEAKKCRFCGHYFEPAEIEQQIEDRKRQEEDRKLGISLEKETKKCPMCSETINLLSKKCELCGENFDPAEVARQIEARRYDLLRQKEAHQISLGVCPWCGKVDLQVDHTGSYWCPNCKKYLIRSFSFQPPEKK
jgi:predicted RNA-binding Zn-ribbon protein involved in translation (DUF1610 family)